MTKAFKLAAIAAFLMSYALVQVQSSEAQAQSTNPVYWRYDAPGQLSNLAIVDINQDHLNEFLIVAEDSQLMLVGADGRALWDSPYQSDESIEVFTAVDALDRIANSDEIVVGTENHIILLDGNGNEIWQRPLRARPMAISNYPSLDAETNDILVALSDGGLFRFNNQGQIVTEYNFSDSPAQFANPRLTVTDFQRDGNLEIVYSYLTDAGFSKLVVIDDQGEPIWERSDSGSVKAMEIVEFDTSKPLEIALATSLDRVYLYTSEGERRWPFRSTNKPITSMTMSILETGPALVVGTEAGTLTAYNGNGQRFWTQILDQTASRPASAISSVTATSTSGNLPILAVLLGPTPGISDSADIVLIDGSGRRLEPLLADVDRGGLSRILDINNDGRGELVLAGFATLELLNPGVGAREYFEAWDYRLAVEPQSVLIGDVDSDGSQEILIGTTDGMLHAINSDGSLLWTSELGGIVSELVIASSGTEQLPVIIAADNRVQSGEEDIDSPLGEISVLLPNGQIQTIMPFEAPIASMLVGDINQSGPPELIIGTTDGRVSAYSIKGVEIWTTALNASVEQLSLVDSARGSEIFASTADNAIFRLNNKGTAVNRIASFLSEINAITQLTQEEKALQRLIVSLDDGTLHSLTTRGVELWDVELEGSATGLVTGGNSLFITTDEQEILNFNFDGELVWQSDDFGRASSIYWGDLNGDVRPDLGIGDRNGEIRLITADGVDYWDTLNVASEVFYLAALQGKPASLAELVAVTDTGIVQLFNSKSNSPPLLVGPQIEVEQGNYSIATSVIDVENDPVTVDLELYDEGSGNWLNAGQKVAFSGNDSLFWSIDPPRGAQQVRYRFLYDDGTNHGTLEPASGPPPISSPSLITNISIGIIVVLLFAGGTAVYLRQASSPSARVRRFYERIQQEPNLTLSRLDAEYYRTGGSADFLLNLANRARAEDDEILASLVDGLYLLSAQPGSALPIIVKALREALNLMPTWDHLEDWSDTYQLGQKLFAVPSITELNLLRPHLADLVDRRRNKDYPTESLAELLPVLGTLRDSERVDLASDKIIYLSETIGLLRQVKYRSRFWPVRIENVLTRSLIDQWIGLIRAEMEELEGTAQLVITLVTKQVVPETRTVVAINVANLGRAAAENLSIELKESDYYIIVSQPEKLPILSPGRDRQVQFVVNPNAIESFRTAFEISYADESGENQRVEFADLVSLIPKQTAFEPITNPYAPGMPLRKDSQVFFGRQDLFDFVANNIGHTKQRNVLTLIGQRRTGKTSALLQLDKKLPNDIFSIYIDCQSLGVTPGMPSLFHDLAWSISDALLQKGYEIQVPETSWWQNDTTIRFQRQFLKQVKNVLPEDSTILLVFDEFETFENLVYDGILPTTLFTYFRHLMQHEPGLGFIFSGTHRLEEMSSDYWSVLFNAALYKHISFLSNSAAENLIRDPVLPHIIYDDLAVDKILRVTAGHPYFLQLVCYTLVNRANLKNKGYITISDVNAALDEMLRLGEVHFAYLWQRSNHAERALLVAASRLKKGDSHFRPNQLVQILQQYNIHIEPSAVTVALNRLVEREIFQDIKGEGSPIYGLRIGLVGQWVGQNKSFSKLYETRETSKPYEYR